jgi:hypothetical protein
MKYLHSRDNYLHKSSLRNREKQEEISYYQYKKIYENVPGSGALGNEINWGDSLLGRAFNSSFRKLVEAANTVQMGSLITRFKSHFDWIVGSSVVSSLSDEDKIKFAKYQVSALLRALTEAVEKGLKVGEIKAICDSVIKQLKELEVGDESEKAKSDLIDKLVEFRKWLDQFKDDEGDVDSEKEAEKKEKEAESESESGDSSPESLYPVMVKSLKQLSLILQYYESVKLESDIIDKKNVDKLKITYITVDGDTIKKIADDTKVNIKKLTAKDIIGKNQQVVQNGQKVSLSTFFKVGTDKSLQSLPAGLSLVLENLDLFEASTLGSGAGDERQTIRTTNTKGEQLKVGEDHLTQSYNKLKIACETLKGTKYKNIGITTDFLNQITSKSNDGESKKVIKSLFMDINRYLVGDKRSTLQELDPLYKESIEIISDNSKKFIVSEKIARFTKRALQFDGENLYSGLGDLGKPLKEFVDSMKILMKMKSVEKKEEETKEEPKEEPQKDSIFIKYDRFMKVYEADNIKSVSQQIKDYYSKNFDFTVWSIKQEEVDLLIKNSEAASKGKKIIINGIGPIIEIMRFFNRAYKIHTKAQIPFSGRTDAKLNVMTMNQWTAFGGDGTKGKGQGPYRNNKIFNQWENAVFDIFGQYEEIFDKGTILRIGDREKKEAGTLLKLMMNDLLDGEKLYKGEGSTGSAGVQKTFLNKYFEDVAGDEISKMKEDDLSMKGPDGKLDTEENTTNANGIKEPIYTYVPIDTLKDSDDIKNANIVGSFFQIQGKDLTNNVDSTYYGYVQESVGGKFYVAYSKTFYNFDIYFKQQSHGGNPKIEKKFGSYLRKDRDGKEGPLNVWGTTVVANNVKNILMNVGKTIQFDAISSNFTEKPDLKHKIDFKIDKVFWLCSENEGNKYSMYKLTDKSRLLASIRTIPKNMGGFEKIIESIKSKVTTDNPLETKLK